MAEACLTLSGITAGYGRAEVLHALSLQVTRGERLAVLGRNGAGKTTLLSTIMGLTDIHAGSIELSGKTISDLPAHRRARLGLGLVPQTRDIFPSLTVEENLHVGLAKGQSLDQAYALFPRLYERRALGGAKLSGGEQQMLSIARCLLGAPDILLLDEPLEGLAPIVRQGVMAGLANIAGERIRTIILVEQQIELALAFAERVIVLDAGRIVLDCPTSEIRGNPSRLERHLGLVERS